MSYSRYVSCGSQPGHLHRTCRPVFTRGGSDEDPVRELEEDRRDPSVSSSVLPSEGETTIGDLCACETGWEL